MTRQTDGHLLVLTNMPDKESAIELAHVLVSKRLAACANVMDGCTSVFSWQGEIQTEREVPVFIKTHADRYELLQQEILSLHPYELPEIVAVPLESGLQAYLNWVSTEVDVLASVSSGD